MKTIRIEVSPDANYSEIINAGVMFEHNATQLEFELSEAYVQPDYKYYIEFAMPSGVARTEYLEPDENSVITFLLPDTVTSQMAVLCYFNIVSVDEETYDTTLVIKPVQVRLSFESVASTDAALAREYSFSVNALLQAIKNGDFSGEVADGSITTAKLADGAVSFEKLDGEMTEYLEDVATVLSAVAEEGEFTNNKAQTLEYDSTQRKYPTVNAVRSFIFDNCSSSYEPVCVADITLENDVSEYIFNALPNGDQFECNELLLQLDAPPAAQEHNINIAVLNNNSAWDVIAGQTNDLKIYAIANKHTFIYLNYFQSKNIFWKSEYGVSQLSTTFSLDGVKATFAQRASCGNAQNMNADGATQLKIAGALPQGTRLRLFGKTKRSE